MCSRAFVLAALLATGAAQTAPGLPVWPVDLETHQQAQRFARDGGRTIQEYVEIDREAEAAFAMSQNIIVLGTATSVEPYWRDKTIYTAVTVEVEECLKGNCGTGSLTMSIYGGTIDGVTHAIYPSGPWWSGPFDITPPAVGDRCIFLLWRDREDPSFLRGGGSKTRYVIKDGQVARKGIPLGDFVSVVRAHAATRTPAALFDASEAVVLGEVTKEKGKHETDILLRIDDAAKGDMPLGGVVRVALPRTSHTLSDCPRFRLGERALVFLSKQPDGIWTITDGRDSKLRILDDGTIEGIASLDDLASQARGAPPN